MPAKSKARGYADSASVASLSLLRDISVISGLKKRNQSTFDVVECERRMVEDLLPYQRDFALDFSHKYVGFCGGFGSGKTRTLVVKQLLLCFRSQGFVHLFLEPTLPLIDDVALPMWYEILEKYGIPYSFRGSPRPVFKLSLPGGVTPILLRSMENYERLIGVNAASITGDEMDTIREEITAKAVVKLQGRIRVGNCPQFACGSTPEGYRWMYSFFRVQDDDSKQLYKGKTEDNPFLPRDYIEDLRKKYPPMLIQAYLNGEFVPLETAIVFFEFNRKKHNSSVFHPDKSEIIVFGLDFNVAKVSAIFGVMRPGMYGQELHCFDETKVKKTFDIVQYVKKTYPGQLQNRKVICYPDASGSHDSTSATETDHEILREAGIRVMAESRNPPILETLVHANEQMRNNRVYVNAATCPDTVITAEQWGYDKKTLKPEKGGGDRDLSHRGDAWRYLIWGVFPRAGGRQGSGGRVR